MKFFTYTITTLFLLLTSTNNAYAQEPTKALSPYFIVKSEIEEGIEQFPLESTYAEVKISGVIADVKITQTYKNDSHLPIEARYVFPGSTHAAIYGMQMTIGERVRRAEIKEKKIAQKIYNEAKKAGKSTSLLEQKRPNVFEMSVANILPGDLVKVELYYTEMLVPESGVYEFVYPAVVGPRFSETPDAPQNNHEKWIANPYQQEGEVSSYDFDVAVEVSTGIPIKELISTTHKVDVNYQDKSKATISFADGMRKSGDRDYVLRYRLQDNAIESGLLLYEGEKENFFTLLVEPPKRVTTEQIPAREYVFIIDVSGSMHGFPLTISKQMMRELFKDLRPQDTFNVVLFAASTEMLSPYSLPATNQNLQRAIQLIDSRNGGGGTRLLGALETALKLPTSEEISRSFIILTDGYISADTEVLDHIGQNLNTANYFAFGIGSSVNRYLIEGIGKAGLGESFIALTPSEAHSKASQFHEYVKAPVLTNISIDWGKDAEVYDLEPKFIPDLLADRPIVVKGKYKNTSPSIVTLKGSTGGGNFNVKIKGQTPNKKHRALRYLWAREKVARLGDYQKIRPESKRKELITELGLQYEMITQFTSFIAVDDVVRNPSGNLKKVSQPLPLPKNVSKHAVGSSVPSTPEPTEWMLLLLVGCIIVYAFREEKAWR